MAAVAQRGTKAILAGLLIVGVIVFGLGINWGLPSRAVNPYLFGNHPVWTGNEIVALTPSARDSERGADVDVNPIVDRLHPVVLNETDSQRAEIVRRYRLFTYQPDEMITLMALSRMRPSKRDFDPKLYQYGGMWIYPVGALIKLALHPRADLAYYLDHPEEFGRMYIVARAYCAAWGLAGIWCVWWLMRRITGSVLASTIAAVAFIFMPVVVNMAHEAKPHLPGVVLMLMTVMAGAKYVESGKARWWVLTGALCGLATGMVLSAAAIFVVVPVAVMLRSSGNMRQRAAALVGMAAVGLLVYALTNPYVPINYFLHRQRLESNIGNSTAMYNAGLSLRGIFNAIRLVIDGAGPAIVFLAVILGLPLLARASKNKTDSQESNSSPAAWLLYVVGVLVMIQFTVLATGKPEEFGRFFLFPDVALLIAAFASVYATTSRRTRTFALAALLVLTAYPLGAAYLRAFVLDAGSNTSRLAAAEDLSRIPGNLGLYAEPAPYCCPPVNLFDRNLVLLPRNGQTSGAGVNYVLTVVDTESKSDAALLQSNASRWHVATPISWANKRFELTPVQGFVAFMGTTWAGGDRPPLTRFDHRQNE